MFKIFALPPWPRSRAHTFHLLRRFIYLIGAPVVANVLYASFASAQDILHHVDPLIFASLQMALLLPISLVFFSRSRHTLTVSIVQQAIVGGLLLGLGFLGVAFSLRTLGIIRAAALTGCDGIIASLIARFVLRQQQPVATGIAGVCAGLGVFLLWMISPDAWKADVIALIVGLLFCAYALYVEHTGLLVERMGQEWGFFSVLLTTMAGTSLIIALCFGSWISVHTFSLKDLSLLLYTSWATLLIPLLLNTLLQRKLSAVSLSFLALLKPLASIGFAWWQGSMQIALPGWIGVGLILLSILVQAYGSRGQHRTDTLSSQVLS